MNNNDRTVALVALLCATVVMLAFSSCEAFTVKQRYAAKICAEAP